MVFPGGSNGKEYSGDLGSIPELGRSSGEGPNPGIKPVSPELAGRFFTAELPGKPQYKYTYDQMLSAKRQG